MIEEHRQEGHRLAGGVEDGPEDLLHAPRRLIADALDPLMELRVLVAAEIEPGRMRHDAAHDAEAQEVVEVGVDQAAGALKRRARGQQEPFEHQIADRRPPHPAVATAVAGTQGVEEQLPDIGLCGGNARTQRSEHPASGDQPPIFLPGQADDRPQVAQQIPERSHVWRDHPQATPQLHGPVHEGHGPLVVCQEAHTASRCITAVRATLRQRTGRTYGPARQHIFSVSLDRKRSVSANLLDGLEQFMLQTSAVSGAVSDCGTAFRSLPRPGLFYRVSDVLVPVTCAVCALACTIN